MEHSPAQAVVVVFARLPVPGKTKTRLAAGVGPEAAAAFYKLCAEHAALEVIRCPVVDGIISCAAAEDVAGVAAWMEGAGAPLPVQSQVQNPDLGHRMIAALTAAATGAASAQAGPAVPQCQQQQQQRLSEPLQQHSATATTSAEPIVQHVSQPRYKAAIVIGTDIPDVTSEVLAAAVAALLRPRRGAGAESADAVSDMVLGPAADGGYYLLGFRTEALLHADVQNCRVFQGVEWSCSSVLARTIAGAVTAGLHVAPADTLPTLQDIDTVQDATAWLLSDQTGGAVTQQGKVQQELRLQMRRMLSECICASSSVD